MYYHSKDLDSDRKDKSRPLSATKQRDVTVEEVLLWEAT
jgi:hypothetical protein